MDGGGGGGLFVSFVIVHSAIEIFVVFEKYSLYIYV